AHLLAWGAGAMTPPPERLRLGTLNVATLAGRVATVLALATTLALDVLVLQETHVPHHSRGTVESAFAKAYFQWAAAALFGFIALWGASSLLSDVFEFLASTGEECIGFWRLADETVLGDHAFPPTRRDCHGLPTGRCVDFALSTSGIPALARFQHRGPSDHDLVSYDFEWARDNRLLLSAPPRLALCSTLEPVSEEAWSDAWGPHASSFTAALHGNDVNKAWCLLSDAAETLLVDPSRPGCATARRSMVAEPRPPPPTSTKSSTVQSHKERRLRHLARRAAELQRHPEGPDAAVLHTKLSSDAAALGLCFTEDVGRLATEALAAAAALETASVRERIANWKQTIQSDHRRMRVWVQRTPAPAPAPLSHGPVHPADVVEAEYNKWSAQWTGSAAHTPEETWRWCLALGAPSESWMPEALLPSAAVLLAAVRASARRAAGIDGWSPAYLAKLPLGFFESLVALWTACLRTAALPEAWCQVRVALIPKPDGGLRPLAIASAVWRALATVVVRNLRTWTLTWAPPSLLGSLPGRSCADLHAAFASDLHRARRSRQAMAGHKADVRRCFDAVSVTQALAVARWLGAPPPLLNLLEHFYARQRRFIAWQGTFHGTPIEPTLGLLQGCPFSPLLLNCICSLWVRIVREAEPRATLAVYLDDRTVWHVGKHAVQVVCAAARAGQAFDSFFGLQLHPDKLGSFGVGRGVRAGLALEAELVGLVKTSFVLLGVHYAFGLTALPDTTTLTSAVWRRCERIAMAVASVARRRALLEELVIPLFSWSGPWTQFRKQDLMSWDRAVALALWGYKPPRSRSRLLLWHVLGRPCLCPEHALDFATARQEWLRCSTPGAFRLLDITTTPSWAALQRKWGWSETVTGEWRTPLGLLRPGWDGLAVLRRVADYAFLQGLWAVDPKASDRDLSLSLPTFAPARPMVTEGTHSHYRTATACAADARCLTRLQNPPSAQELQCVCGEPTPTRHHLTFACSNDHWQLEQATYCERSLLLRLVPLPMPASIPRMLPEPQIDEEVVHCLIAAARHGPVLCATDGGALTRARMEWWQRAAWAVAFGTEGDYTVYGDLVAGLDQTPAAAERAGLWHCVRHLRRAQVPAVLYLDNFALVLRLRRGLERDLWAGSNPGYWHAISQIVSRDLKVFWVPSHGKQRAWQADDFRHTTAVRALNAQADTRCSAALLPLRAEWEAASNRLDAAESWTTRVLKRQHAACARYHELLRKGVSEWR
ncbi:pol, partial [Symbiodinium necroappetens]